MKLLHFSELNNYIELRSQLYIIKIENKDLYRNLCFNLLSTLTFSINNEIVDINKKGIVLFNPFEIKLNDKKFLNHLYKKMESNINDECLIELNNIEMNSMKLFEYLSMKSDCDITYNHKIDFSKFLASFDLKFDENEDITYIELLSRYCKLVKELLKVDLIFCYGLSNVLKEDELLELNYLLSQLDLNIIDIIFGNNDAIKDVVVDKDWCII